MHTINNYTEVLKAVLSPQGKNRSSLKGAVFNPEIVTGITSCTKRETGCFVTPTLNTVSVCQITNWLYGECCTARYFLLKLE